MDIKKIPDAIGNKVKNFTENSPVVKKALEGAFEQAKDILVEENTKPMPEEVKIGIDLALGIGIFAIAMIVMHAPSAGTAAADGLLASAGTTFNIENLYYYVQTP